MPAPMGAIVFVTLEEELIALGFFEILPWAVFKPIDPIGSMYVIFTYIWLIFLVNVGKYIR